MSALFRTAYRGTIKQHPLLFVLLIFLVLLVIAWKLILWPRELGVRLEAIKIHRWNISKGLLNHSRSSVPVISTESILRFSLTNPSFSWNVHVEEADVYLMLVTPHFKYPLAVGKVPEFQQKPRSKQQLRVSVSGNERPLLFNSKYLPLDGKFRLLFQSVLRSRPKARWFWLPVKYQHRFSCLLTCSLTRKKDKSLRLKIVSNKCGLS